MVFGTVLLHRPARRQLDRQPAWVPECQRRLPARMIVLRRQILPRRREGAGPIARIGRHSASAGTCARRTSGRNTRMRKHHQQVTGQKDTCIGKCDCLGRRPAVKMLGQGARPCRPSSRNQWAARRWRTLSTKALRRKILRHQVGSDPRRRPLRRLHRRSPLGHPISPRLLRPVWRNPMPLRAMPALTPLRPTLDARARDDAEGPARGGRPPPAPPGRRSL